MRYPMIGAIALLCVAIVAAIIVAQVPDIRQQVRAIVRPEPPAPITPLAVVVPTPRASASPVPSVTASPALAPATPSPRATAYTTALPPATAASTAPPTPEPTPLPTSAPPTPALPPLPIEVNGRRYDAYIPAATKPQQAYQYSCEFDAAWVIFESFGRPVSVDEMIGVINVDTRVEPYMEETANGFIIHGGDIATSYSGDFRSNFLARSTGGAMRPVFEHFGFAAEPVRDRAGVEAALRSGRLVWMKTTVDFKPWRPAIWLTPEGQSFRTVLGNDHAVVVIGFNAESVVIRDVLGPTSSNQQRPYEYEVDWETFLRTWEAQDFDGLAVGPQGTRP